MLSVCMIQPYRAKTAFRKKFSCIHSLFCTAVTFCKIEEMFPRIKKNVLVILVVLETSIREHCNQR